MFPSCTCRLVKKKTNLYTFFVPFAEYIDTGIVCCPRFVAADRVKNGHQRCTWVNAKYAGYDSYVKYRKKKKKNSISHYRVIVALRIVCVAAQ